VRRPAARPGRRPLLKDLLLGQGPAADDGRARSTEIAAAERGPAPQPVAAEPQKTEARIVETQKTEPPVAQAPKAKEPVATAPVESPKKPAAVQAELVTASVEPLQPVRSGLTTSSSDRVTPVGRSVFVDETGGHVLSITYPRADYGIIQVDKTMPEEVRLNTLFSYTLKVTNLTETMLTEITIAETVSNNFEFKASEPTAQTEGNKLVWQIESSDPRPARSSGSPALPPPRSLWSSLRLSRTRFAIPRSPGRRAYAGVEEGRSGRGPALRGDRGGVCRDEYRYRLGPGRAGDRQPAGGMQTADGKGKVVLEAGTLGAGETRRFSIKLRAVKTGAYVGKALATSAAGLKAESEPTTTNVRQPALSITKSGPHRQYLGRPVAYEISVFNKGDGPAQNTIVEDIIPRASRASRQLPAPSSPARN